MSAPAPNRPPPLKPPPDAQEQKRIKRALQLSEEAFARAFRVSPLPTAIQSQAEGRFLDVNPAFVKLTGYTAAQLLARREQELHLWNGYSSVAAGPGPQPAARVRDRACLLRRCDGTDRDIVLWAEPIALAHGPCRLLFVEDVTERLRLGAQLRQAQKLETVGCLTAGIAHEFNNLLTVIQGHADILTATGVGTRAAAEAVARISQASHQAAALTGRLLAFSRKQPLQFKPVDLSAAVQGLGQMLAQFLGELYQLHLDCPPHLPPARADESSLEQIVINLALHARDALPAGGSIRVGTSWAEFDAARTRIHTHAREGRFVCLTVADDGRGMANEPRGRSFDPFRITQEAGEGTGFGLATVRDIVQKHEGWIDVTSEPESGSTFRIFLPVWEGEPAQPTAQNGSPEDGDQGAGEAVLIVEDEEIVREAARLALERGGYVVFEAPDGPEALKTWERCPARIALLVTDMVMPRGVSGGALARLLQSRDPSLRVLYTSGYGPEAMKEDLHLRQGIHFLRKPYDPPTLLHAVKLCLKGVAGAQAASPSVGPKPAAR
jgi:two-component system, cell cycle sensor histidine kinase and response regulator CckA